MSLLIQFDIADVLITQKAFAVQDDVLRGRNPGAFGLNNVWAVPGGKAVTLYPDQIRAGWGQAAGKWGKTDWTYPVARYDLIQRRGLNDWFFASKGLAQGANTTYDYAGQPHTVYNNAPIPLTSVAPLPENGGLFVEFWGYGVSGTRIPDLLQVTFAGGLTLHIHSDGSADLYDGRPGFAAGYLARGLALTGQASQASGFGAAGVGAADLLGKLISVLILPYRRGRLLIVTNQGGFCDVAVGGQDLTTDAYKARRGYGESAYHLTTAAGQVTLTPSPSARALVAANPLTCAQALTGLLTSPLVTLPYAVSAGPEEVTGQADAQDGSAATLTVLDATGDEFAPDTDNPLGALVYEIGLTTANPRVFPVFYDLELKWARMLGDRPYGTSIIPTTHTPTGNVVSARLSLSRERQSKSFEFEIDNPGEYYTSLKDVYNRRVQAVLDGGGADAAFGIPAGEGLILFSGLSDPVEFLDGYASRVRVPVAGLRKRLRSHLLSDSEKYDGQLDTDVVRKILVSTGIDDADIITADDGGRPLDSADPGDDALWRPDNGQSADEFIQHIADTFSGWVFDDIGGKYYYVPREYFTLDALAQNGGVIPTVYQETPLIGGSGGPGTAATRPVNTGALVALADSVRQTTEEPRANDIYAVGMDADGNLVSAHWEDPDGIKALGERRTLIYASGSLTTQAACQRTVGALSVNLSRPVVSIAFALPDYQLTQLPLEGPLVLDGYDLGLITGVDADLNNDRNRRTEYRYEVLV